MKNLIEIYKKIGARKKITTCIYLTLKQAIITGLLHPKEKIDDLYIAQELDVSQSSVREAIKILEYDHFITFVKNNGYEVEDVTLEDMAKINEMLSMLSIASIELMDSFDPITSIMLSESINRGRETSNLTLDRKFHMTLAICSKNREILKVMKNMFDRLAWGHNVLPLDDMNEEILEEHRRIVEYFTDNKNTSKEALCDIMTKHYNTHLESLFVKHCR